MFFKKARKIKDFTAQNKILKETIFEVKKDDERKTRDYEFLKKNLHKLCDDYKYYKILDFFDVDNDLYVISMNSFISDEYTTAENKKVTKYELEFIINDLFVNTSVEVCKAGFEYCGNSLNLIELDTDYTYFRKGFASKCLMYLEDFCKDNNITKIYGMLLRSTPIGLDGLTLFYEKNGYEVYISKKDGLLHFRKYLNDKAKLSPQNDTENDPSQNKPEA